MGLIVQWQQGRRRAVWAPERAECPVIFPSPSHLPLPLGVAGHEGSTVIVGLNGMRLLAQRAWSRTLGGPP